MTYNTALVLVGAALLGALCGAVGTFAVLRRRALLGDALAHAALPGVALAFLATGLRELPILLAGALATGIAGIALIAALRSHTRTKEDAALGLVLSVFFGIGIALSRYIQNVVPDGSQAGLDTFLLGKTAGIVRQDVLVVGGASLIALIVLVAFFKEFKLVSFDPDFARSLGWKTTLLDFTVMGLIAMAVVVGLPMVGVVMVAALTILPAVTARFLSQNLGTVVVLAALCGIVSASAGVLISASAPQLPTGPIIILCAGALFAVAALFAPRRGLLALVSHIGEARVLAGAELIARVGNGRRVEQLSREGVLNLSASLEEAKRRGVVDVIDGRLVSISEERGT